MRLSIARSSSLSAIVRAIAASPTEVRKQVRQHSQSVIGPEWKQGLAEHAPSRIHFDRLVNKSAVSVSDRGVSLKAGSDRASNFTRETEFGAYREAYEQYRTRKGNVNRRTQRQFWHYQKKGRVVFPTARVMIPRIAALWVQTAYRTINETLERAK